MKIGKQLSGNAKITNSAKLIMYGILLLFLLLPSFSYAAINFTNENNYCIVPPFIETPVTPNLLLTIDNSASMFDLFWIAGSPFAAPTYDCGGTVGTVSSSFCYDNSYSNAYTYEGYFKTVTVYKYVETPADNAATPAVASDKWEVVGSASSASWPACGYKNATGATYVCIGSITGTGTLADPYKTDKFYATGNFLNWLSASKFDIEKKILTGGKYDAGSGLLTGETRGCVGRRFVKVDPNVAGITFAVRGPNAEEPDNVNPDTLGGLSRIEVYKGTNPNIKDCQCAVANWTLPTGSFGQAQTDSKNCLNIGAGTAAGNEIATFNHSLQTCWKIKDNISKGATTAADIWSGLNTTDVTGACKNAYGDVCGKIYKKTDTSTPGLDYYCDNNTAADLSDDFPLNNIPIQPKLKNEKSGNFICTGMYTGVDPLQHVNPGAPYYTIAGSDRAGFLGRPCASFNVSGPLGNLKLEVTWANTPADTSCVHREILHYCYGASVQEAMDPSEGAADTSTTGSMPAVMMDASVRSLGDPAGTFFIKVPDTNPTGLIQEYSGRIRFGAQSFNNVGTPTECVMAGSNIKCPTAGTNLDGSQVLTPVSEVIGDHATAGSLIYKLDGIVAETWTPFSEAFYNAIGYYAQRTALRLNAGDFTIGPDPSQTQCQKNNILLISDGLSTADLNPDVRTMAKAYADANTYDTNTPKEYDTALNNACMKFAGSRNMDDIAWVAQNRNIYTLNKASDNNAAPVYEKDRIYSYVVYNGLDTSETGECNPLTLMQDTASRGGGSFAQARNPAELQAAIRRMLEEVAGRAASGTAASVLASGEGSGANLLQAIFYPKKEFEGGVCSNAPANPCTADAGCPGGTCQKEITWSGTLHNLWYFVDPKLGSNSIRENTEVDTATDKLMKIDNDYIINFDFDTLTKTTFVRRYTSNAAGTKGAEVLPSISLDSLSYVWEAGKKLHSRTTARTIWTQTGGTLTDFSALDTSLAAVQTLLQASTPVDAGRIIKYVSGYNKFCQGTATTCNKDADCGGAVGSCENIYRNRIVEKTYSDIGTITSTGTNTTTWKLGDVVNSTPKLVTWVPLNPGYERDYHDTTYTEFLNSDAYKYRGKVIGASHYGSGMVFAGANDGMLHAFKLGALKVVNDNTSLKAEIIGDTADDLGKEAWAFIPKSALPYLTYLMDPNYSHLYYVDLTTYTFDASIGAPGSGDISNNIKDINSWRTILIGGMRFGGATKNAASTYGVQTPVSGEGFSSYFALDITNPASPQLLWEFSHPDLGFTTTGPAVVKINARDTSGPVSVANKDKNGKWFVVFASGPTGPIDTSNHQFNGFSDQNLKLFILDLKASGSWTEGTNFWIKDTGIANAFGGSMNNATIDYDLDYQDDALYVGYTKSEDATPTAATKWTQGGVVRLITREDLNSTSPAGTALDPVNWKVSTVIDNIGAVTSAVSHLAHYPVKSSRPDKAWLYFGTGRYFYKTLAGVDDPSTQRRLYGIKEPCLPKILAIDEAGDPICDNTDMSSGLDDATNAIPATSPNGWFIDLDVATITNQNERVITDTLATPTGAVFFATFSPTTNVCDFGGLTHLWATKYDTGGSVANSLKGSALLQVSTGEIKEIALSQAFKTSADNPDSKLERRSMGMSGVPPTGQGLSIVVPPKPIDTFLHIRKK